MMTQHDAERVENLLRLQTGIGPTQSHAIATEAHLASNSGEWGTLVFWNGSEHVIVEAMPRHRGDVPDEWRFTTKGGLELFLAFEVVSEFRRSGD